MVSSWLSNDVTVWVGPVSRVSSLTHLSCLLSSSWRAGDEAVCQLSL